MKQDRAERRRNHGKRRAWYKQPLALVGLAAAALVTIFVVVLAVTGNSPTTKTTIYPVALSESVVHVITQPDVTVLDQVKTGGLQNTLNKLPATALLQTNGKTEVIYLGAEYCPF